MRKLKQDGFGAVQLIILVLVICAIGGLGWYAVKSKNTNKTNSTAVQPTVAQTKNTETPVGAPTPPDPTADWTPYSSTGGKFSLKYPKTWVQPVNRDYCTPGLFDRTLYLGPDAKSVLKCATEFFGQMSISSTDGDKRTEADLGAGYKSIVKKDVTINGVAGQRISGVASSPAPDTAFAPAEGTIEVHYVFFTPTGITYMARYTQAPKDRTPSTDVLADFDLMVTKTLKFSS